MSSPSPQPSPSKATKPFPTTAAAVKKQVVVEVNVKEGDNKEDGPKEPEPVRSAAKQRQAEASAKAAYTGPQTRIVFMRDLEAFLKGKGMLWDKYPTFVNAELDLYKVYTTVADWGGSESVTEQKKWKSVADALKLAHLPTSASHSIKNNFMRYLRDYELYRRKGTGAKKRGRPPKVKAPSTSTSSASKDSSTSRDEPKARKRKADDSGSGNSTGAKKKKKGAEDNDNEDKPVKKKQPNQYTYRSPQPNQYTYRPQPNQYTYKQPNQHTYKQPNQYTYKQPNQYTYKQPNQHTYKKPQPNQYTYKKPQPNQYTYRNAGEAAAKGTRGTAKAPKSTKSSASSAPTTHTSSTAVAQTAAELGPPGAAGAAGAKPPKPMKTYDDMNTAELHIQSALEAPPKYEGEDVLQSMVRWLVALGRSPLSDAALVDGEVHAVRSLIVRQAMSQGRNSNRATAEIIVRLLGRHPDEEDSSDEDEDFAGVGRGPLRGRKKGSRVGDEFQAKVSEWRGMAAAAAAAKEKEAEAALVGPCVRTADEQEAEGSDDGDASVETANWPNGNPKGKDDDEQEPAEDDAMVVDNPGVIQLQLDPAVIEWTGNVGKAEAEDWTEDEKRGFCEGMYAHGNDLLAIQKEHVPSKTIRRVVGYYYNVWRADLIADVARWKTHMEEKRKEEEEREEREEEERLEQQRAEHARAVARKELRQSLHWARNASRCIKTHVLAHIATHTERLRPLWISVARTPAPDGQLVPVNQRPVSAADAEAAEKAEAKKAKKEKAARDKAAKAEAERSGEKATLWGKKPTLRKASAADAAVSDGDGKEVEKEEEEDAAEKEEEEEEEEEEEGEEEEAAAEMEEVVSPPSPQASE